MSKLPFSSFYWVTLYQSKMMTQLALLGAKTLSLFQGNVCWISRRNRWASLMCCQEYLTTSTVSVSLHSEKTPSPVPLCNHHVADFGAQESLTAI